MLDSGAGGTGTAFDWTLLDKFRRPYFLAGGLCPENAADALVEAHDDAEVDRALAAGARILGVNNRNLKDFTVDTANSRRLRSRIPQDVLFVSESGVKTAEDVARLAAIGADAVLIGEALMRAPDKTAKLQELKGLL